MVIARRVRLALMALALLGACTKEEPVFDVARAPGFTLEVNADCKPVRHKKQWRLVGEAEFDLGTPPRDVPRARYLPPGIGLAVSLKGRWAAGRPELRLRHPIVASSGTRLSSMGRSDPEG